MHNSPSSRGYCIRYQTHTYSETNRAIARKHRRHFLQPRYVPHQTRHPIATRQSLRAGQKSDVLGDLRPFDLDCHVLPRVYGLPHPPMHPP